MTILCSLFEHILLGKIAGEVPDEEYTIPFGQSVIRREGVDVTVVALSRMVHEVLTVAEEMERKGISLEVMTREPWYPWTSIPL